MTDRSFRYASLETATGKETGEVLLILGRADAQTLVEMGEAAVKAAPRKSTFKRLLKTLIDLPCY